MTKHHASGTGCLPMAAGLPGRIHVSESTHRLLPHEQWESTGGVEVKGKVRVCPSLLPWLEAQLGAPLSVAVTACHALHYKPTVLACPGRRQSTLSALGLGFSCPCLTCTA